MNISKKQEQVTRLIEEKLEGLQIPEAPSSLYEPVRYTLSLGGKRVRPYLTLTGCGLCGGDPEEAIPAAVAIELLHNFTLLHDDIMDAAETRRGKPSVFEKWDSSTAILSGDAMYVWAFEQLRYYGAENKYSKKQYAEILDIFLNSARIVCEGQAYDLEFEDQQEVRVKEYLKMIEGKTSALISGAICLGGVVASANENQLSVLHDIGKELGIAFQIQDDLLDAVADPSKFGKKRGGDIFEGKKTYLSILSLQKANAEQQNLLRSVFNSKKTTGDDVKKVIELYWTLGVIDETKNEINRRYNHALNLLEQFRGSSYKTDFTTFITNLVNREY